MKNLVRWIAFATGTTLVGLVIAFLVVFLSRLYGELQSPAFLLVVLVLYSGGVALAAINYATRLDSEEAQARTPLPSRARTGRSQRR